MSTFFTYIEFVRVSLADRKADLTDRKADLTDRTFIFPKSDKFDD